VGFKLTAQTFGALAFQRAKCLAICAEDVGGLYKRPSQHVC
jgi:hypothetical protein